MSVETLQPATGPYSLVDESAWTTASYPLGAGEVNGDYELHPRSIVVLQEAK